MSHDKHDRKHKKDVTPIERVPVSTQDAGEGPGHSPPPSPPKPPEDGDPR